MSVCDPPEAWQQVPPAQANGESGEIARFCSQCGLPKGDFDVFCGQCLTPLVRRYRTILVFEILLFLASGLAFAIAHKQGAPAVMRCIAALFVSQVALLYVLRLCLRQKRFLILVLLALSLLASGAIGAGLHETFYSVAPLYLALGTFFIWLSRLRRWGRWGSLQTLWPGLLIVGWSLAMFATAEGLLQAELASTPILSYLRSGLAIYTPWLTLAGFALTLAIESGIAVSQRAIYVKPDYYPDARLRLPEAADLANLPLPLFPLVVAAQAFRKAFIVFFNTVISVLNMVTRCCVFVGRVIQAFVFAFTQELKQSLKRIATFAWLAVVRVAVPLFAVFILVSLSLGSSDVLSRHAFGPSTSSTLAVVWLAIGLVFSVFTAVICLGKTPIQRFVETYCRDVAVLVGYGIPILFLCMITLVLINKASIKYLDSDLGLRLGPLSWLCLVVLMIGAILLWRTRLRARLAALRAGIRYKRPGGQQERDEYPLDGQQF